MPWVELGKNRRTSSEEPLVTFGQQGIVYLNKYIMHNLFSDVKYAIFLHDKSKNKLAIKPVTSERDNSYRVIYTTKSKSTGAIAARSVIKGLKVDFSKTKQMKATWNERENQLEVSLEK